MRACRRKLTFTFFLHCYYCYYDDTIFIALDEIPLSFESHHSVSDASSFIFFHDDLFHSSFAVLLRHKEEDDSNWLFGVDK